MKRLYLAAIATGTVIVFAVLAISGASEEKDQYSGPDINVSRQLPDKIEEGETLTVTLKIQDPVRESLKIEEKYSGLFKGEKSFIIENSTSRSVSYYSVQVPKRTGELNFQGDVEESKISGDSTVEIIESEQLFIDLQNRDVSSDLQLLPPSTLGGLEKVNEYLNDGSELVDGLEATLGANYGSGSEAIYLSFSLHNTTERAERAVNRVAKQQVEAGNRDKVERVNLNAGIPALKVESIEDRFILNWAHGPIVFEVQAENPVEHARTIEERYQSWTE